MNFWWRSDPPAWSAPLRALSPLYAAGAAVHRAVSRPIRAGVPVISVGNLAVGQRPVAVVLRYSAEQHKLRRVRGQQGLRLGLHATTADRTDLDHGRVIG